mmetsp:Transcript_66255/g.92181  ORF Transcript_66255/g.92181 Transcript_66255/m.92181 type:complete len:184 (-) Transcript_66255:39-590(-)
MRSPGFMWLSIIGSFITFIMICCNKEMARSVPSGYIILGLFTFCEAYGVSAVCKVYVDAGYGDCVAWAAVLTAMLTFALTAYAWKTKEDWTTMGPMLFVWGLAIFFMTIMAWLSGLDFAMVIISCLAVGVYGSYLIYDTQLIMGGKTYELQIDDYVWASAQIYLDIIILFLRILRILAALKKK